MSSRYAVKQGDKLHVSDGCFLQAQVKHTNLGKFHMSYNYTLRKAIDLSGEAFITIAKLITEVENENQIFIKQSVMAKQFGISRFTFMRHLNRAKELGLI